MSMRRLILFMFFEMTSTIQETRAKLYCSGVNFDPKCSTNEVIDIEYAIYGRIEFGKCLIRDEFAEDNANNPKFLNCSVDVHDILDNKCSGQQNCTVTVLDNQELLNRSSCYPSLPHYMDANYSCISVIQDVSPCEISVSNDIQYILGSTNSRCGSGSNRWKLTTGVDKQIIFDLLNFNRTTTRPGWIVYGGSGGPLEISSNGTREQRRIYRSDSNKVELEYRGKRKGTRGDLLLLRFHGEDACLGFNASLYDHDHVIERRGRTLVLTCTLSNASWTMECNESHWIGQPQKCIKAEPSVENKSREQGMPDGYFAFLAVVIICSSILIGLTAVCIYWIRLHKKQAAKYQTYNSGANGQTEGSLRYLTVPRMPLPEIPEIPSGHCHHLADHPEVGNENGTRGCSCVYDIQGNCIQCIPPPLDLPQMANFPQMTNFPQMANFPHMANFPQMADFPQIDNLHPMPDYPQPMLDFPLDNTIYFTLEENNNWSQPQ